MQILRRHDRQFVIAVLDPAEDSLLSFVTNESAISMSSASTEEAIIKVRTLPTVVGIVLLVIVILLSGFRTGIVDCLPRSSFDYFQSNGWTICAGVQSLVGRLQCK